MIRRPQPCQRQIFLCIMKVTKNDIPEIIRHYLRLEEGGKETEASPNPRVE